MKAKRITALLLVVVILAGVAGLCEFRASSDTSTDFGNAVILKVEKAVIDVVGWENLPRSFTQDYVWRWVVSPQAVLDEPNLWSGHDRSTRHRAGASLMTGFGMSCEHPLSDSNR